MDDLALDHIRKALTYYYGENFYNISHVIDIPTNRSFIYIRMSKKLASKDIDTAIEMTQHILSENGLQSTAIFDWGNFL